MRLIAHEINLYFSDVKIQTLNDEECLMYLKQSNPVALKYLIRIYFPVLCRYSEKITFNKIDSEDITEEVFIKIWQKKNDFESFAALKSFMYTATRNASINKLRDKKRELARKELFIRSYDDFENDETDELVFAELLAEVRKSIDMLPKKMREIFILSYYKKMSNQEISEHLNLSEQTVRNQKTKAILKLKVLLNAKEYAFLVAYFIAVAAR